MENQPKPLVSARTIISDSWKLFTSTWNTSIKTSSLLLYVGFAYLLAGLIANFVPSLSLITALASIAGTIVTAWVGIRVLLTMLKLEAGEQPLPPAEESKKAWSLFLPIVWIGLLSGLIIAGTTLLFILPGIYFAVGMYFGQIFAVEQNLHGWKALSASRALVQGRWWPTFWRLLAGGVVFGLVMVIASAIVMGIVGSLIGTSALDPKVMMTPLQYGITQLAQMLVIAPLISLMIAFQIKLYRQLQQTR